MEDKDQQQDNKDPKESLESEVNSILGEIKELKTSGEKPLDPVEKPETSNESVDLGTKELDGVDRSEAFLKTKKESVESPPPSNLPTGEGLSIEETPQEKPITTPPLPESKTEKVSENTVGNNPPTTAVAGEKKDVNEKKPMRVLDNRPKPATLAKEEPIKTSPVVENKKEIEKNPVNPEKKISSIRTYASDISNLVKEGVTLSDVALSEQKRRVARGETLTKKSSARASGKNRVILLVTGVFLILGVVAIVGIFIFKRGADVSPTVVEIPPIIFSNESQELSIANLDRVALFKKLNKVRNDVRGKLGSITNIYITKSKEGGRAIVGSREFLEALEVNATGPFLRALGNKFMLGVHVFDGNQALLIFEVDSFENALAGILDWEKFMLDDLWAMFYDERPSVISQESTGSSTPETTETKTVDEKFKDIVLKNKDARILEIGGEAALIYSFPSRGYLIITTEKSTMVEAYERLTTSRFRN